MDQTRIDYGRALAEASAYLAQGAADGGGDPDLSVACPDRAATGAIYPMAALDPQGR